MKTIITLEEVAFFLIALVAFHLQSAYAWWLFPACLLLPDLSITGYLAGPKVGAYTYNIVHHRAIALVIYFLGWTAHSELWLFVGIILFAHSSMDRVFGYGLKYVTGFTDTHLGKIGKRPS